MGKIRPEATAGLLRDLADVDAWLHPPVHADSISPPASRELARETEAVHHELHPYGAFGDSERAFDRLDFGVRALGALPLGEPTDLADLYRRVNLQMGDYSVTMETAIMAMQILYEDDLVRVDYPERLGEPIWVTRLVESSSELEARLEVLETTAD